MGRALKDEQTHHQTVKENDIIAFAWSAIEILKEDEGNRKYTIKSDIWSFGITMWEIFTHCKKEPYEEIGDIQKLYSYLNRGKRLEKGEINDKVYEIMMKCWEKEPSKRPTFSELYQEVKKLCPHSNSIFI